MNQYKSDHDSELQRIAGQETPQVVPMGQLIRKVVFHIGILSVVAVAGLSLWHTYADQQKYQQQYEQAKTEQEQAVAQNREVFQATQQLKDPAFLEDIARRDYYYTKPGEVIFELGQDANNGVFNQDNSQQN